MVEVGTAIDPLWVLRLNGLSYYEYLNEHFQHCHLIQRTFYHFRFGATAKPVDNVHAPDFSSNRCASFLHPYIEYHSFGEYIDQMELQESLIVRFDAHPCSTFPQWPLNANENYIKYYINEKVSGYITPRFVEVVLLFYHHALLFTVCIELYNNSMTVRHPKVLVFAKF